MSLSATGHARFAAVADHLRTEFGARIETSTISAVVRDALHDLQGSTTAACTVGLECLARRRLVALSRAAEDGGAGAPRRQSG